jgi:hypothetical protein
MAAKNSQALDTDAGTTDEADYSDVIGILSLRQFSNSPELLRVVMTHGEFKEFVKDPTISSIYWKWQSAWTPDHLDEIKQLIEDECNERATPKRHEAIEEVLKETDKALTPYEIRQKATEKSGLSYGHGRQVQAILDRVATQDKRHNKPHYRAAKILK